MIAHYHAGDEIQGRPGRHDARDERKHAPSGMSTRTSADQKAGRGCDRQRGEWIVSYGRHPVPASPPPTLSRGLLRSIHGVSVRIHVS
jgi:hypothetical protein